MPHLCFVFIQLGNILMCKFHNWHHGLEYLRFMFFIFMQWNFLFEIVSSLNVSKLKFGTYLWNKVVCLFCFVLYLSGPPNKDASDCVLGLFGKLSRKRGASAGFMALDLRCQTSWTLNDFFTENYIKSLECEFGVVGKILISRILWNLFGKIWI
jgi:hypothetical protein